MTFLYSRKRCLIPCALSCKEEVSAYCADLQPFFDFDVNVNVEEVLCDRCSSFPSGYVYASDTGKYPWLYELQCSNLSCEKSWYMCRSCLPSNFRSSSAKPTRVRKRNIRLKEIIEEHHVTHHSMVQHADYFGEHSDESTGDALGVSDAFSNRRNSSNVSARIRSFIDAFFDNFGINGKEYVMNELKERNSGILGMIASSLADSGDPFTVSLDDAVLHLMFTRQFLRATRDECNHNVEVLARLNKRYQKDIEIIQEKHDSQLDGLADYVAYLESQLRDNGIQYSSSGIADGSQVCADPPSQRPRVIRRLAIPTTPNDCRQYLEGRKCVLSKVPCPNIKVLEDGYAYVSVKEVLLLLLAMGIRTPQNTPTMNLDAPRSQYNKPAFLQLMIENGIPESEYTKCLILTEWTDGVETSSVKSNRGSLKVTTVTIECPERTHHHTFVVGAGKSKSDHNNFRVILYQELNDLRELHEYYDSKCNSIMEYRVIHYACIADRPEVGEATGIGNGNALYCTVPSICFPLVVAHPHPSRKEHVRVKRPFASCQVCYEERVSMFPAIFHSTCDACDDWNPELVEWKVLSPDFPPGKVPVGDYHSSCTITFKEMRDQAVSAFEGVSQGDWNKKNFTEFLRVFQFAPVLLDEMWKDMNADNVSQFDESFLPAKMRCTATLELFRHLPGIMHLIFQGVAKTTLSLLQDLLKQATKYAPFHVVGNAYLQRVRSLSLAFCKVWNFGSPKTPSGPWVGESYLGYVRIMKGLYSLLEGVLPSTETNQERISLAQKCIWSFVAFVSRVMQDEYSSILIEETECILKVFLSDFESLDRYVRDEKKKPRAETTGNVTYLLRIPQLMRDFGPLREFWEGSIRGEGIFRYLKPLIRRGVHNPGACRSLLQKYYCDRVITWILEIADSLPLDEDDEVVLGEDNEEDNGMEKEFINMSKRYSDVNTHESREKLQERVAANLPLSLLYMNNKLYAKYRLDRTTTKLACIQVDNDHAAKLKGTDIFPLKVMDVEDDVNVPLSYDMFEACVGCSMYATTPSQDGVALSMYYVVSSSWKELTVSVQWVLPMLYV